MDGFLASALAAFFGGALSFVSPCVLPLVPGYLCFAAGLQFSELSALEEKGQAAQRILPGALAFVGGFSAVFIALGAGAAAINPLLLTYQSELAYLAGGAIIILGLHVSELIHIPLLAREARLQDNMRRAPIARAACRRIYMGWPLPLAGRRASGRYWQRFWRWRRRATVLAKGSVC